MKMQWKIGNVEIPNPFVLAPMAGSYGSCISKTLQGAGSRTDLYGDGQRQGNFFS